MTNKWRQSWMEMSLVTAIFLMLTLGEWLGVVQPLVAVGERVVVPRMVATNQWLAVVSRPLLLIKKSYHSARKVQELEQSYTQSLATISELEYLAQENQVLRQLLELKEKVGPMLITSPITSHGEPSLGLGAAAGVKTGQPVLSSQTLLGLIKTTTSHQAAVNLLFQNSIQPILVKTESGVEGLVIGDGKNILLTEIPREAEVVVGERVVTIGQEHIQPQLFVGQIQQVIDQPAAATKQAIINQEVSFYEVTMVEILL